jgi:hypothetical protein
MQWTLGIVGLFFWILPTSAFAATYYVTKTGNDANSCTQAQSQSTAKVTIQAGVNCATAAGDVVSVSGGTYVENVTSWRSGVSGKPIVLQGSPGNTVVWKTPTATGSSFNCQAQISDRSYLRIEGFIFRDAPTACVLRVLNTATVNKTSNPVQGIEIVNNTFINNGGNASLTGWMTRQIYFQYIGRDSSYTGSPVHLIQGNVFTDNYGAAIDFDNASDVRVANNTSTGALGSKNDSNANWYQANLIQMGGTGSQRNIIESNNVSNIVKQPWMETNVDFAGVRLDVGPNKNIVRDNVIHDIGYGALVGHGIHNEADSRENRFYNNLIYRIGNFCVLEGGWWVTMAQQSLWLNNTIYDCGKTGILLGNTKNSVFKNNIIMNAGIAEIVVWDKSVLNGGNVFSNNLYYNSSRSQIGVWNSAPNQAPYDNNHVGNLTLTQWMSVSKDTNSLSLNPQFVNAATGDFHLQTTSPAIDRGIDVTEVLTDFGGTLRPQGAAYDIGANEFGSSITQPPPPSPSLSIPGRIELESFDTGEEGVAYHDTTLDNLGGAYRTTAAVDIKIAPDAIGYTVGYTDTGEWLKYTINVAQDNTYAVALRVANGASTNGALHIDIDGANLTGTITIPPTGSYNIETTISASTIFLAQGMHTLRIYIEAGNFDLNWIEFTSSSAVSPNSPGNLIVVVP